MIGAAVSVWTLVAAIWLAAFVGCLIGWMLRESVQTGRRGGMLDLTPAPEDGSLGMDWRDPRAHDGGVRLLAHSELCPCGWHDAGDERQEAARRWSETTRAEQDAWVKDGTIASWRLDHPLI